MITVFRGAQFRRETLPAAMTQLDQQQLYASTWEQFVSEPIPPRGGSIGTSSATSSDPFPEILVVRDEDYLDTWSWLNSYLSPLSPISQWCRVLSFTDASRIAGHGSTITLDSMLGAWVGAILAECSVQAGGVQSLREVPGSAAISTSTFAAGRATAVWGDITDLYDIASRHDSLSRVLRGEPRPLTAEKLLPVWSILQKDFRHTGGPQDRDLGPINSVLATMARRSPHMPLAEVVERVAAQATDYFDLPELVLCARGPQPERVNALDRLAERLSSGPKSPVIEAVLGLGASFVDPGSAVSPELLRKHAQSLPVSQIWQGVFAGAMMPFRIMTDQAGLGRLVSKSLLAASDLRTRPSCDIAFDELSRWITPGRSLKTDMRGMSARVLSVELLAGVTCAFSYGRQDAAIAATVKAYPTQKYPVRAAGRNLQDLYAAVQNLEERLSGLEAMRDAQGDLDLGAPKEENGRKRSGIVPKRKR